MPVQDFETKPKVHKAIYLGQPKDLADARDWMGGNSEIVRDRGKMVGVVVEHPRIRPVANLGEWIVEDESEGGFMVVTDPVFRNRHKVPE